MQRYFECVQDANGRAVAGATVTVRTSGVVNPIPVIYQTVGDKLSPDVQPNPMTTDSLGNFGFAAPDGTYDIEISGGGIPMRTRTNVNLFDGGVTYPSPALGTVTSVSFAASAPFQVAGSPITGSGTISLVSPPQAMNLVYAGPASGGAATPDFRALVAADLPLAGTAGNYGDATHTITLVTNAQGQATSVTPVLLQADFATQVTGKPTTLAGYGITDAASAGAVSAYTGDVRWNIGSVPPDGWLLADGSTIGDTASGATHALASTYNLFKLIWDNVATTYLPMYTSTGTMVGKGASADADWGLHYRLTIPDMRTRFVRGVGTLGLSGAFTADPGTNVITFGRDMAITPDVGGSITISNVGGALPAGLTPGSYYTVFVSSSSCRLATTLANAVAGTVVDFTDAGTGTHTGTLDSSAVPSGHIGGNRNVALRVDQLPPHSHTILGGDATGAGNYMKTTTTANAYTQPVQLTGSAATHSVIPQYVAMYAYIKL